MQFKKDEIEESFLELQKPTNINENIKPEKNIFGFIQEQIEFANSAIQEQNKLKLFNSVSNISSALAYRLETKSENSFDFDQLIQIISFLLSTDDVTLISSALYCISNLIFFKRSIPKQLFDINFFDFFESLFNDEIDAEIYKQMIPLLTNLIILMEDDREHLVNLVDLDQLNNLIEIDNDSIAPCFKLLCIYVTYGKDVPKLEILQFTNFIYQKIKHLEANNAAFPEIVNVCTVILISDPELYKEIIDLDIISELLFFIMPQNLELSKSLLIFLIKVSELVYPQIAKVIFEEIEIPQILSLSYSKHQDIKDLMNLVLSSYISYFPTQETMNLISDYVKDLINEMNAGLYRTKSFGCNLLFNFIQRCSDYNLKKIIKFDLNSFIVEAIYSHNGLVFNTLQVLILFLKRNEIEFDFSEIIEAIEDNIDSYPSKMQDMAETVLSLLTEEPSTN
ncbi:hypothetical protein TVAG_436980 [Trichomonas vaginalis G3]|uniref:Uncharacterized protein n=1 Tax=Trichomonas vaginalis (strain ATCC PRA-98 / G3) TaxID=412133 RepID=A2DFE6_TRIV3|nr:armadillo (ARM) repeat-containing protein family [Trichomonas vaginalis G3]EAY20874.1 hypothetical protein TVAG_436980 [Trichomonas vaginalis G3]KAI5521516.1 armadillo (ARM) repeat-containing protein family [Trichomonas vaginalis G3]|eukprot:XP_001581860.1 hypothetical protein [Trichomonas vaginalis G3]